MRQKLDDRAVHRRPSHGANATEQPAREVVTADRNRFLIWLVVAAVVTILVGLVAYSQSVPTDTPARAPGLIEERDDRADDYSGDWKDTVSELERRRSGRVEDQAETYTGDWKDTLVELGRRR